MTFEHLPDRGKAEALVLAQYLKYAIMFPVEVSAHTKAIMTDDCTHCIQVMALVNALIHEAQGV